MIKRIVYLIGTVLAHHSCNVCAAFMQCLRSLHASGSCKYDLMDDLTNDLTDHLKYDLIDDLMNDLTDHLTYDLVDDLTDDLMYDLTNSSEMFTSLK